MPRAKKELLLASETNIDVPFHDVDSMGIAWHGHYAKYIEVARCEWLDKIGYGYKAMFDSGFSWPIVDMRIKYIKPLFFEHKITVITHLEEWEYRLKLNYIILDANSKERLSKAHTTQVAVDQERGDLCFESPAALINKLTPHLPASEK